MLFFAIFTELNLFFYRFRAFLGHFSGIFFLLTLFHLYLHQSSGIRNRALIVHWLRLKIRFRHSYSRSLTSRWASGHEPPPLVISCHYVFWMKGIEGHSEIRDCAILGSRQHFTAILPLSGSENCIFSNMGCNFFNYAQNYAGSLQFYVYLNNVQ